MSLYSNHYPENADLTLDQMNRIEGHYQMLIDGYEDRVKEEYYTLTAILKDGTVLSGGDLGELIYTELNDKNMKQLMPVLNAIYKEDSEAFNYFEFNDYSVSIGSGKELGQFIVEDGFDDLECFYDDYYHIEQVIDAFCQIISGTKVDLHDFPQVFKAVYDLNDKDDLQELAEKEYQNEGI